MNYNNPNRNIFLPVSLALAIAVGILIGKILPSDPDLQYHSSIKSRNDKISNILNIIEEKYVDTVNRNELSESAIPAILKKLDPHSIYIPAKDLARANEPLQGNFEGIGISFNMFTDTILVISTIPGGPSEKQGLLPLDKIIYVNDSLVAGKKIADEDVMRLLKGPKGTVVRIKILRTGHKELLPFEITRDKIPIYSVDVNYMVNNQTGYIRITSFAVTTYDEFMNGILELRSKGMKNLILDLRGNSGGVMEAAIRIANEFLAKDQLIVYTLGRSQPRNEARANSKGIFQNGDLVILIDEWSASASEILAGAIQDNDRGTIIGRRSFGKGLVQEPVSFSDGSGMRLTIARYYTPTGRSIQKPYKDGFDKYYDDLNERYIHGEFDVSDSIQFSDSLKFTTSGGRIVYGGGGIMPDKFVPVDTTMVSPYLAKVRALIYRFALKYTENNNVQLKRYTEADEMEKYLDKQALLDQFVVFAENNNVKRDPAGLKTSGKIIHTQLKAYIARNVLDNKGFYPIWEEIDTTLKYAIEYLEK
ncbi:MAG: peptidase S41 [Bacteroidetes bacterium GWE2_41_25]|nr:MAG: peptidase S41 [Bacteroidetes bacterium GWA2_40_15]OFX94516.1 MAG: peptidase S41 [Bacteroidetes bacterium GWC2_40_22]OFX96565.1 MAG: peptidase S41 [Bacteroidetes bacterium GWE2_41_25]OFY59442.1 MAG: peptidase S41 [Bacteroidetes bacterium GWF2_41_9]HCU19358.1 peptidase S41 [Bacteroidales bacterium]